MAFTQIRTSKTVSTKVGPINIVKFKKDGTKRVFWTPVKPSGQRITKTMYGRMNEAVNCAKAYGVWSSERQGK